MEGQTQKSLTSLERLEAQIRALPDGTPQGAAWEAALVGWVNGGGHPDLVKGWGWKQWPGRAKAGLPRIERGVDLIAEDRAGRLVAIQAKFRNDPDSPVRTGEVQKFVGAYRKHFPRRMLISNASSRARGIKEAVGDTEAELVLRTDLIESPYNWITAKPVRPPKITPLPFQKEAAAAIKKHLKDGGRAQIVMACGSGKTYTTLLAMEALGSKRVLVLAPTLLLVKQLRDEWMRERTSTWATLAVCSDIGTDEGDDSTHVSPGELGSKPTTDPVVIASEIKAFVKAKLPYVVFGTYASSARIATAQKKAGVPAFDLVVADEAHRIAGAVSKTDKGERAQRVVLDEKGIRAERRLFATATPRVYGGDKKKDSEEIVLESMDDPARFGGEVYKLTFQQAVDLDRLVPYKLLVTIVTDKEVEALIRDRAYLDVDGKKITTDDLATAIAVRRAYKELGISRVISYHGSIKRARAFAQLVQDVKAPGKAPETECVTGSMAVEDRKEALTRLAQADGPYLITNARCLTEGIDVPALDAVAFADPRRSQVDIVQAVGRAMRKPRGTSTKTTGYIILPVFLSDEDLSDPEAVVEGSAFAPVLQVLRALKAHDPQRATFFANVLAGAASTRKPTSGGIEEVIQVSIGLKLDRALAKQLESAVQLRAVEVGADRFEFHFLQLTQFIAEHGHSYIPIQSSDLGRWVNKVRTRKNLLTTGQQAKLNEVGFTWDVPEAKFQGFLALLKRFVQREGHAQVPLRHIEDGQVLGLWLQRVRRSISRQSVERRKMLLDLGVVWESEKRKPFEFYLSALKRHFDQNGDIQITSKYRDAMGVPLGQFVADVRARRIPLTPEQTHSLEVLGVGDISSFSFTNTIAALQEFVEQNGHSNVHANFRSGSFALGNWINQIRRGTILVSKAQATRLGALGIRDAKCLDESFNLKALQEGAEAFRRDTGHLDVPASFMHNHLPVGRWILYIRRNPEVLEGFERVLLDGMNFTWTQEQASFDANFEVLYAKLLLFRDAHGHVKVPIRFSGDGDLRLRGLGPAVSRLRQNHKWISAAQNKRLERIGFVWSVGELQFDRNLELLREYKKVFGDCNVPRDYADGDVKLGTWVSHIKKGGIKLTPARRAELIKLGFEFPN